MGDTVVGWVEDATVWACRWTIFPERQVQNAKRAVRRQQRKMHRSKPGSRKESEDVLSLPLKALSHGSDDVSTSSPLQPLRNDLPSPDSLPKTQNEPPYQEAPALDNRDAETALEQDIERIGSDVEHFEEEDGRGDSLAARLAREISNLAKDLDVKPPKKYDWEDWVRWLDMLGEMENPDGEEPEKFPKPGKEERGGTDVTFSAKETVDAQETAVAQPQPEAAGTGSVSLNVDAEWRWTWLSDHGPLLSRLTETEWIIERLCFRLEEVIVDEIREAHARGLREGDK